VLKVRQYGGKVLEEPDTTTIRHDNKDMQDHIARIAQRSDQWLRDHKM
jgi:hypothetical protein